MRRGTYSIVARDPASGELGVAAQSHWFSVGSIVCWAEPGVGAVATQSIAEPAYGPALLDRLGGGAAPEDALSSLLEQDPQSALRQVATVDGTGAVAVHTGAACVAHAGHRVGEGYSVQANMMASPGVWPAMAERFEASAGPLARRLLAALVAGEAAGGDVRGKQSAALLVVPASGEPWRRTVDLRVEDDAEPLEELARLLDLHDAYAAATRGDLLVGQGRHEEAGVAYRQAAELAPGSHELMFWAGLALAGGGDVDAGAQQVQRAVELQPSWRELLARLSVEIAPAAEAVRQALGIESSVS